MLVVQISLTLIGCLVIIVVLSVMYEHLFVENDHGYKAEFGSEKGLLSRKHAGFAITTGKYLTRKQSYENFIALGKTGSGKGVHICINSIENVTRGNDAANLIVHDPSGETRKKVAGFLEQRGITVLVLNFNNAKESLNWNPLTLTKTESDIRKMIAALSRAVMPHSSDPFWNIQSCNVISCMTKIIKTQEPIYHNLYNVRNLIKILTYAPEKVDTLFLEYADEELLRDYKSLITFSPKMLSSIIATSLATLSMFDDPDIALVTSSNSIDFHRLRRGKVCVFIQNSIADIGYYAPLVNILLDQLFAFTMATLPSNSEKDIFFILDEAGSLYVNALPVVLANIRKHRAGILLLGQEQAQFEQIYGVQNAKAILANCSSHQYFKGQSLQSARELEAKLGKYEWEDEKGRKQILPLLTADSIRMLPHTQALFICDNYKPLLVELTPYYTNKRMRRLCSSQPKLESKEAEIETPQLALFSP